MTTKQAEEIILKFEAGTATEEEKSRLETWYARFKDKSGNVPVDELLQDQRESWMLLEKEYLNSKQVSLWPRIAAVAAAVTAITLGVWFYNISNTPRHPDTETSSAQAAVNDIAPGKNGATITLANGKVIQLSDAKSGVVIGEDLKYSDGEILRDALDDKGGVFSSRVSRDLVASTTKGQTYEFILPDGTHVWLNADSRISFSSQFIGKTRKILLEGEAYFEVAKNKKVPFIVQTDQQTVEVLGTHFNINSYKDEGSVKTTLLEGSVLVSCLPATANNNNSSLHKGVSPQGGESGVVLKPNEQASLTANKTITVDEVNPNEAIAWKNGKFMFNDESLESIMRKIERWYDVDVEYQGVDPKETFGGSVSRFENVSKVLKKLELTGGIQFKIEGRKIVVSKGRK
ncbi:FecR family protein [Pedobacter frigoris]|uniref:FecR family protein n=1 Tax=Pedobacter frigoris TaxID=2571272 RepID=UPI00292E7236|nr:FecR domain-containing protein [Pedobacter frigoris]